MEPELLVLLVYIIKEKFFSTMQLNFLPISGYFRDSIHRRWLVVLHVQCRRFQVPSRHDSTCTAAFESSLCLLLCSDQPKNAICLFYVPKGNITWCYKNNMVKVMYVNCCDAFKTLKYIVQFKIKKNNCSISNAGFVIVLNIP